MGRNELFDRCAISLEELLRLGRLRVKYPYSCPARTYFGLEKSICTGIIISTVEGKAGLITRVYGVAFVNVEHLIRCTDVHNSYYGEATALSKLLCDLESLKH